MPFIDLIASLFGSVFYPRRENESIVGESPMERNLSRFWMAVKIVLVLAALGMLVYKLMK